MHFARDGLAALLTVFALAGQGLAADTTTDAVTTLKYVAGTLGSADPAYAAIMDAIQAVASGIEQPNKPNGATYEPINKHGSSGGQGKRAARHGRSGDGIPDIDSVSELEARAEPLIPNFELNYSQNERRDVDDEDEHDIAARSPKGGRGGSGSRGSSGSFGKGVQAGGDLALQNPDTMQAAHDFFQQGLQIFSSLLNGRSEDSNQLAARSPKGGRGGSFGSGLVQGVRTGTDIASKNADTFQQAHDLFSQGMELLSNLQNL